MALPTAARSFPLGDLRLSLAAIELELDLVGLGQLVEALVLVELAVLRGHEGDLDVARDLIDRDETSLFGVELGDQPTLAVVDVTRHRRAIVGDPLEIGQVADHDPIDRSRPARRSRPAPRHRCWNSRPIDTLVS